MLIEDDPIFRLGIVTSLAAVPDFQIVLEAASQATALVTLQNAMGTAAPPALSVRTDPQAAPIDVILLSLDLAQTDLSRSVGLALCQQLRSRYPALPVLLLGSTQRADQLIAAFRSGAAGYYRKGTDLAALVNAIRLVAAGQADWTQAMQVLAGTLPLGAGAKQSREATTVRPTTVHPTRGSGLRQSLWLSGVQQIERAIASLDAQLADPDQSLLNQLVLAGHRRELRVARWLVNRLLAPTSEPLVVDEEPMAIAEPSAMEQVPTPTSFLRTVPSNPSATDRLLPGTPAAALATTTAAPRSIQVALFDTTAAKLQASLANITETPLEIDILKEEKKRELLYIILRQLETTLDELRFSQVQPDQLVDKQATILGDLWQAATTDFFGKYATLQLGDDAIGIVDVLLQEGAIVQTDMLSKIPLMPEFFAHLLFQVPLMIDDAAYVPGSVEAMARMELLLQNLIIQLANAVVQPLLNRFGDVVTIKQTFYDKRLLSSREIERFRNNLSWKYRFEKYFGEPTAIFESCFYLFALREQGITKTSIYAPRNDALAKLSGIQLTVTLALETRDAIAPRLRSAVSFVGSGIVYVLTEVIGRGIGLIGRGIVKGVGNALQDSKLNRKSERWR